MNSILNLYHDNNDDMCIICNIPAKNYFSHMKSQKHQYKREQLANKILMKELTEKTNELNLLKLKSNKIIKMYHYNDCCPICLDETKECFRKMFDCTHGCCEDCFSKIDKCSICRAPIKS